MLNHKGPARLISVLPLLTCFLLSSVATANRCHQAEGLPQSYKQAREKSWAMDQLVRHTRATKIFPFKTHLHILAKWVGPHLDFVRESIPAEGPQAAELKALEAEAKKALKKSEVTYSWWIRFNAKLARTLTNPAKRTPFDDSIIQSLITQLPDALPQSSEDEFPTSQGTKIVLFPWIEGSEVSLISEVQSFAMRAESLPLISGSVHHNGKEVQPDVLFAEALKHAQAQLKAQQKWVDGAQLQKFHRFFMEELEMRPAQERELALWVYWLATRVHTMDAEGLLDGDAVGMVKRIFEDDREQLVKDLMDPMKYQWLLPSSVDPNSQFAVKSFILESQNQFELIASLANAQR